MDEGPLLKNDARVSPTRSLTDTQSYDVIVDEKHEKHSPVQYFPWSVAASLLMAGLCCVAMVVILVTSNNDTIEHWTVQPAVYLAITTAVLNICLRYAFAQGAAIQWWVKSLKGKDDLASLHRNWVSSENVFSAIGCYKAFSLVHAACIACVLLPINSPLLQKASEVGFNTLTESTVLKLSIAAELPYGYTGFRDGKEHQPYGVTNDFATVMAGYTNHNDQVVSDAGCTATCRAKVLGAGFISNCSRSTVHYDSGSPDSGNFTGGNGTQAFGIGYNLMFDSDVYIQQDILLKQPMKEGTGDYFSPYGDQISYDLINQKCAIRAAIIRYPVLIQNGTISLDPKSSYHDDEFVSPVLVQDPSAISSAEDTIGGFYLMLKGTFNSSAEIHWVDLYGWTFSSIMGLPAVQFLDNATLTPYNATWNDPTDTIREFTRQVMFRTALRAGSQNTTFMQQVESTSTRTVTVYKSNFLFLGLSLLATLVSVVMTSLLLIGWKGLGRKVSLSPIDTARFFDASVLAKIDPDDDVKQILHYNGHLRARRRGFDA